MELSAKELRIGNLVGIASSLNFSIGMVTLISIGRILLDGKISSKNNKFIPIPLTEEWLLRFGFEKDDSGVDIFDQDYCEWYQKEFPIIGILCQSSDKSYIFDENSDTLRLKYVHELQNLYFALTGEELTI